MDAASPPQAPRRPPSLRWAWIFHLVCAVGGAGVVWLLILMIFAADGPNWLRKRAIAAAVLSFQLGVVQFSLFRIRRGVAAKAPGMCPVYEYQLAMTKATASETPILCPECGYRDTAQGVKAFWTRVLGGGTF